MRVGTFIKISYEVKLFFVKVGDDACDHLVSINDIPVDGGMSGICPLG